ncbi:MAG: quinone-dependent dihydroorotate dehydrogenase, partial [Pseudomonadota bacterium]
MSNTHHPRRSLLRQGLDAAGLAALKLLDPETAHGATIRLLKAGLAPKGSGVFDPVLETRLCGMPLDNLLGLAAGFDKHAEAVDPCLDLGFGFVEIGAVTPKPQPGNPKPRVFRLPADRAVINRYGFNSEGLDIVRARLAARRERGGVVGVNLGANKESADRTADFVAGLDGLYDVADFFTVNVSSPNTPGLRDMQGADALKALLQSVVAERDRRAAVGPRRPVLVKIAPDLTDEDASDIASVVGAVKIDGVVVSNTTVSRPEGLTGPHAEETGGLSGAPLFEMSTRLLADMRRALPDAIDLIGVGGVSSAADAYQKVLNGAAAVQLYTALIYEGPGLVGRIVAPEELREFRDDAADKSRPLV